MRLTVPRDLADELAGDLGRDSLGVDLEPRGELGSRLRLVFASRIEAEGALARVGRAVAGRGLEVEACAPAIEEIPDEGWVERYRTGLRPFAIGKSFVVAPGADPGAFEDRIAVRLSPGRAFGTGEHPTTRLCVEALETRVRPGSRWVDVGTGSGILAVVAARLGAAEIVAIDIDPEAVAVAEETVCRNEVGGRVVVEAGTLDGVRGLFDGAVVNILERYFMAESRAIAAAVREGGILLASGFEPADVDPVAGVLETAGFRCLSEAFEGGWALLELERLGRR